ncbi:MAG: LysM peptidoglycan-binding domain-containing protein [Actinomycetes bacterium]
MHLTRRGRVVVTVLLVGLILALSVGVGAAVQARPDQAVPTVTTMTVRPGDTLWGIASRVSPGVDPRGMVLELRRLNPSSSGQLQAGQVLVVPTAAG